jgi:hypothetical protein
MSVFWIGIDPEFSKKKEVEMGKSNEKKAQKAKHREIVSYFKPKTTSIAQPMTPVKMSQVLKVNSPNVAKKAVDFKAIPPNGKVFLGLNSKLSKFNQNHKVAGQTAPELIDLTLLPSSSIVSVSLYD